LTLNLTRNLSDEQLYTTDHLEHTWVVLHDPRTGLQQLLSLSHTFSNAISDSGEISHCLRRKALDSTGK